MLRRYALVLGLIDHPTQRKQHVGKVPLIGGLAIFMGVTAGAACYGHFHWFIKVLIDTTMLLTLLGALDDRFDLSVRERLVIQTVAILTVIATTGVYIHTLGTIFGYEIELGWLGYPFTVVAVIGLVNAFNMMDGIDGLAGCLEMVSIAAITLFVGMGPLHETVVLLALLATASLPYLLANLGLVGRKIFLGDAGSTLIGYLLAWVLIRMTQLPEAHMSPVNVLWCVALPVFDTLAVMVRRMRQGKSPFKPDRGHIHHIMLGCGFGPRKTLLALIGLAGSFAFIGVAISHGIASAGVNLMIFCLTLVAYIWTTTRVWARQEAAREHAQATTPWTARGHAVATPASVGVGLVSSAGTIEPSSRLGRPGLGSGLKPSIEGNSFRSALREPPR
ncbi:undecaprenyl/decaprenyl-phosphate alpha-N-acetylglucosaminyl 1-phosphate transferase [Dyella jiangningensis]|nr:undecaprenyl/decaprenyl-phosphate alpha-N-acetylglucosaminyl 1-phosphate transferase [Dyella jiangningensis]